MNVHRAIRTAATVVAAASTVLAALGIAGPHQVRASTTRTASQPVPTAYVGVAKLSMEPRPADYGGTWTRDRTACARMDQSVLEDLPRDPEGNVSHLADAGSPWPENPNCLYMGGFGIGPANPITAWDQDNGLWIRSVAIGDGTDTVVLTTIDAEGYFWDYAHKCADCGAKQLSADLGRELGIDPSGIILAATHAHSAPDLIGGWGFVPDWYMRQVTDTIRASVRQAVGSMRPAVLETGEQLARDENHERRDTYRSAEEQQLTWLRAYAPATRKSPARTIATIGGYAAHATTLGTNDGVASADWPGVFEKRLEQRFGGVGFLFETGLGNMSASGGVGMGTTLADLVPAVGAGRTLDDTDVRSTRRTWSQPLTNVPITALGTPGFFDRRFQNSPASLRTGEKPDTAPCLSASPTSAEVAAGAVRIGDDFALTTAPGETFANFSNTVKEKSGALVTMPLAQANDALGYMPQDFEMNRVGQQGLGFVVSGVAVVNYEDSYAVDHCFGDMALETTIDELDSLR